MLCYIMLYKSSIYFVFLYSHLFDVPVRHTNHSTWAGKCVNRGTNGIEYIYIYNMYVLVMTTKRPH